MDKINLNQKKQKLEQAKINLKNYFVGIDNIIDEVIDRISAWYIMPNLITRPLIVNLWGLTGVGKTDLIRRLVKELEFADRFMEMQMSSKAQGYEKNVYTKLMYSDLEPGQAGILLLDEIQRFRTVDEKDGEIRDYDFQDIWMLLSDGKFAASDGAKEALMEFMCEILYKQEAQKFEVDDDDDEDIIPAAKRKQIDENRKFKRYYYEARKIKRLLKLDIDIKEIMMWDDTKVLSKLEEAFNDPTFYTEIDYSKLLIFISGNLDEAYKESQHVSDSDRDADDVYNKTKRVNIINIKNALLKRFKPEQIARFGNTHIIYPSLNRNAFEILIDKRVSVLEGLVKKHSQGIEIKFSKEIKTLLYNNGVFPTQGVRPLYSTIDDFFNKCIPNVIIKALENNIKDVNMDYSPNEERVIAKYSNGDIYYVPYVGALDEIKKERRLQKDQVCDIAVHEAGHAVLYALLFKTPPTQIIANTTHAYSSGYVSVHEFHRNHTLTLDLCKVYYGGYLAEELVFGKNNISNGTSEDISQATAHIANAVRLYGQGNTVTRIQNPDQVAEITYNFDYKSSDLEIEELLLNQKEIAKKLLIKNKNFLVEVANYLMENYEIKPEKFCIIANKHNVQCECIGIDKTITFEYLKSFEEFCK